MAKPQTQRCVVIMGAGFAGFHAARELSRLVGATTEIVVINSTDYFLYLPLMPQVAGGLVEPRHVCVSLSQRLRRAGVVLGTVDHVERAARCTFVVVGAGYTGTEVTAQGQLLTTRLVKKVPGLAGQQMRWMLLDTAPRLLPELNEHLSKTASRVLHRRGVEVLTRLCPHPSNQTHIGPDSATYLADPTGIFREHAGGVG